MLNKRVLAGVFSLILALAMIPQMGFAEEQASSDEAERVVLLYICGSDLESYGGFATQTIMQILDSAFSQDEDAKCIVMTGGSDEWMMDSQYLYDPQDSGILEYGISADYNQIWEAKGSDAQENPGKLVLLDGDGITGDGEDAALSEDEPMSDPETLKAFINFGVQNYPAKRYDLVLWDHAGGPLGGFANDENCLFADDGSLLSMTYEQITDAVADNDLVRNGGRFDLINFDACLMGNVEMTLALEDYADYYIASAETEPSAGQDYRRWFNTMGENPAIDTFELGKIIVDDYIDYYKEPDELDERQDVTLAVIDMGKLRSSGFAQALIAMDNTLKSQIREGDGSELLYYDEAGSVEGSIRYSVDTEPYRDLGNLAGQLCICLKEPKKHLGGDGMYTRFNDYENASKKICSILGNEEIIYVRGSNGITAPEKAHIDGNGEIKYESMSTSGLYLFFPTIWNAEGAVEYYEEMCKLANGGNVCDADCVSFLSSYSNTVLDYALLTETGSAVTALVGNGVSKGEIDYAKVREYWESTFVLRGYDLDSHTFIKTSLWDKAVKNLFAAAGGEEAVAPWLEKLISQQAGDAVQAGNVSASKIQKLDGEGLMVHIDKTDKRVVDSVNVNYVTELPAVFEYYKSRYGNTPEVQATAAHDSKLPIGTLGGSEDYSGLDIDIQTMSIDEILDCYSKWYEADSSAWVFGEASKRMFALEDAQGNLHAAQVIIEPNGKAKTYIEYQEDDADYDDYSTQKGVLVFNKESDETYALSEFYPSVDEFSRPMTADDLKAGIDGVKTVYRFRDESPLFTVPITKNGFTISKDTMKNIRLVYANIDDVEDIADIDGDGEKIQERYVVKDMYHHETDITDAVKNASGETIYDIGLADVENVTFNGKDQGPKLTFKGAVLKEGVDYEFAKSELIGECRSVGSYEGTVIGKGRFTGSREVAFSILAKKINPSVALAADEYTYNGKAQKPSVTVKDGKTKLSSSDYTVSYQAGCKNVGSYRVSVKLKGNYEGNVAVKFKIVPKGTTLRKAKQSNKAATVIWKPQKKKMSKKRITGYEIQVATNKSFTKNKKTVTVKGYKKTSKRITGLKQNKRYFVRVRTYLKARGGMFCSSWSKAKPIK